MRETQYDNCWRFKWVFCAYLVVPLQDWRFGADQQCRNLVQNVNDLAGGLAFVVHIWRGHCDCVCFVVKTCAMIVCPEVALGGDAIDTS